VKHNSVGKKIEQNEQIQSKPIGGLAVCQQAAVHIKLIELPFA
jgi:hypothetical protein